MPTTPIHGLPYPTEQDPADVPADIEALAMALDAVLSLTPTGSLVPFAGTVAPPGWLLAHGQAVDRAAYANLFALIGISYGAGDGSTTFNLPDMRGRVAGGLGGGSFDSLGEVLGAETVVLDVGDLPVHAHRMTDYPAADFRYRTDFKEGPSGGNKVVLDIGNRAGATAGTAAQVTTGSAGLGEAHGNIQPTLVLNYLVKT